MFKTTTRHTLVCALGVLVSLGLVTHAWAGELPFEGTTSLELVPLDTISGTGTGIATVTGTGASLASLALGVGTMIGPAAVFVTDTEITPQIVSISVSATRGSGSFMGFTGGAPLTGVRTLPLPGLAKICLAINPCAAFIPLTLTETNGTVHTPTTSVTTPITKGVGVGGLLTAGGAGTLRFSVSAAPWTLGTVTLMSTNMTGLPVTQTRTGLLHGPASNTSTAAAASGVVQLVTPMQITTFNVGGNNEKLAFFGTIRIQFVPEPGLLLLLGSGVAGLLVLGRRRTE